MTSDVQEILICNTTRSTPEYYGIFKVQLVACFTLLYLLSCLLEELILYSALRKVGECLAER
jgi:hypothetical protein